MPERLAAIVAAHDDADFRIAGQRHALRHGVFTAQIRLQRVKGFLRLPLARDQAEGPVRDVVPAREPLIRPRKKDRPRRAAAHHTFQMPREDAGLLVLAFANRVHAEFPEDQRLVLREVLQPGEVLFKIALPLEIDVVGDEIDIARKQKFRRRITGETEERPRIGRAGDADEFLDKLDDVLRPEPAHDGKGDLVPHVVTEDRLVPRVLRHARADRLLDLPADFSVVQKLDVLRPRDRNEHPQPELPREIEEPPRRHVINAQEIDPHLRHQREIAPRLFRIAHKIPRRIRRERPIGHALDEPLPRALEKELRPHADRQKRCGGSNKRGTESGSVGHGKRAPFIVPHPALGKRRGTPTVILG